MRDATYNDDRISKKKIIKKKKLKDFYFFNFKKRGGGPLIRACSLIRSNTVHTIGILFVTMDNLKIQTLPLKVVLAYWKVKTPCHAHGECIN